MRLEEFECKISLQKKEDGTSTLEEHDDTADPDGTHCSANICSVDGARFSIAINRLADDTRKRDVMVELALDGRDAPTCRLYETEDEDPLLISWIRISRDQKAPLKFCKVDGTDDAPVGSTRASQKSEKLGTIEIRIYHVRLTGKMEKSVIETTLTSAIVDDKAMKDRKKSGAMPLSHKISLHETTKVPPLPDWHTGYEKVSQEPIAVFRYSYASRHVLEACRRAPRTSLTPTPSADDPIHELQTANDELKRRIARMEKLMHSLKRARPEDREDPEDLIDLTCDNASSDDGSGGAGSDDSQAAKRARLDP